MKRTFTTMLMTFLLCVCAVFGLTACDIFVQEGLESTVLSVEQQVSIINGTIDDMKATDATLKNSIDGLTTKVTKLESDLESVKSNVGDVSEDLEKEIADRKADVKTLQDKDSELQTKINALETALSEKEQGIKEWANGAFVMVSDWTSFKTEINATITALTSRIESLESAVGAIDETLTEMQATDTSLQNGIDGLTSKVGTLENDLEEVNKQITFLQTDSATKLELAIVKNDLEEEIDKLKTDIVDMKTKDKELQDDIESLQETLSGRIDDMVTWISDTFLTVESWNATKAEIENEIEALNNKVGSIETMLSTMNTAIAALQAQTDKNTQDIEALQGVIDNLKNCINGKHEAESITYTWSNDFAICTAKATCKHCLGEFINETTTNITVDGFKYTATFENPLLKAHTIDLTDLTTVPSANYESALNIVFSKKNENVTLTLPEDFGTYRKPGEISSSAYGGNLISKAIKNNTTNVNLTLKGIKKLYINAFYNNQYLVSISLPDATEISNDVFQDCTNLKSVSLPKVTKIWGGAFGYCTSLDEIDLPSATDLGNIFYYASFKKVKLGSAVTEVSSVMFDNFDTKDCILILAEGQKDFTKAEDGSFTMSEKEMSTGDTTFCGCEFKMIVVGTVADCKHETYFVSYSWSSDFSSCTAKLFCGNCAEAVDSKTVNATLNGFVYSADFEDERIPKATIDLTDLTLMSSLMYENALNTVFSQGKTDVTLNLPKDFDKFYLITSSISNSSVNVNLILNGVEQISEKAFRFCQKLQSINLPDVTAIEEYAFLSCSNLDSVSAEKVQKIGERAFSNCESITSLSFPEVTEIGEAAFGKCIKVNEISLPKLTKVSELMFYECDNLKAINLPSVTELASNAFSSSNLESITFGSQITAIGNYALDYLSDSCVITLAKGQKDFYWVDYVGLTGSEDEVEAGKNKTFCEKTFAQIIIADE